MNFPGSPAFPKLGDQGPHRGRANDRVLDDHNPLATEHLGQRRVFQTGLVGPVGALDECPAHVAVAHQAFQTGDPQFEGHGGGGSLGGVGDRDDDRVVVDGDSFESRQFFPEGLASHVDAAVIERAGDVGEVDPLEEAVGPFG